MAWKTEAVINLKIDNKKALEEIKAIAKNIDNIEKKGKDGVALTAKFDEKGFLKFEEIYKNINKDGANLISFEFDKNATLNNLGETTKAIQNSVNAMVSEVEKRLNRLDSVVNSGAGVGGDKGVKDEEKASSSLSSVQEQLEKQNQLIKEKQSLLDGVNAKIKAYADEEIAAAKRVQDAHKKYMDGDGNRFDAVDFMSEYDDYLSKYDENKLGYKLGRKNILPEDIGEDFDDAIEEYKISTDKLKSVKKEILKDQHDVVTLHEEELNGLTSTVKNLRDEIKKMTSERDDLIKSIEGFDKKPIAEELQSPTSPDSKVKPKSSTSQDEAIKDKPVISGEPVQVKIEPANLAEFTEKIKTHLESSAIDVKIEPKVDPEFVLKIPNAEIANAKLNGDLEQSEQSKQESTAMNDEEFKKYYDGLYGEFNAKTHGKTGEEELGTPALRDKVSDIYKNLSKAENITDKQLAEIIAVGNTVKGRTEAYNQKMKNGEVAKMNVFTPIMEKFGLNVEDMSLAISNAEKRINQQITANADIKNKVVDKKVNADTQQKIQGNLEDVPVDVQLNASPKSISSLKAQIEAGINPIDVNVKVPKQDVKKDVVNNDGLVNIVNKYKEIYNLQAQINAGNRNLVKTTSTNGKQITTPGISPDAFSKNGTVLKSSIQDLVKQYNEAYKKMSRQTIIDEHNKKQGKPIEENKYKQQAKSLKEQIALYSGSYKDVNSLHSIKAEGATFWSDITDMIAAATKAQEAYLSVGAKTKELFAEISAVTGTKYTDKDAEKFNQELAKGNGLKYIENQVSPKPTSSKPVSPTQLPKLDVTEQVASINKIKDSINSLITNVPELGVAFNNATNNIAEETNRQIASINGVKDAIGSLSKDLEKVGVKSVKDLSTSSKDLDKIKQEQDKLLKQKESLDKIKAQIEQSQVKNKKSLSNKEILKAQQSLIDAGDKTNSFEIDKTSIKASEDGVISFKAVIKELDNVATVATYKLENLDKAITATGKISPKALSEGFIGFENIKIQKPKEKVPVKSLETQFNEALAKTKNFNIDEKSLNIDKSGVITFTKSLDEAGNKIDTIRYKIDSLNSSLNKDGSLKKSGLKDSIISDGELTNIDSLNKKLLETIRQRRVLESRDSINIEGSETATRRDGLLQQEISLEQQINALIDERKLTLLEVKNIEDSISNARTKDLKSYQATDTALYEKNKKFAAAINSSRENLNSQNYIGRNIDIVNSKGIMEVVTLNQRVEELTVSLQKYLNTINSGNYVDNNEFNKLTADAQEQLDILNKLNVAKNLLQTNKTTNQGSFLLKDKGLSEMSNADITKEIRDTLLKQYKDVKVSNFNKDTRIADVELFDNGKIQKTTASINEYTNALSQASVGITTLNAKEQPYLSAGERWVSGFKSKIHSLSQYVTGLELVMRAWNEVKEGFNFVKDLDGQLTTISQTMDATAGQLKNLGSSAIAMGKELGTSAQSVMDAAAIYANANETAESILAKSKPTVMLANASGGSASESSDQIQAVIEQFSELEGQEMRIVNSYEKISKNIKMDFQRGIGTIAEGVQTAGKIAADSGMKFEDFASSIAKVAEKSRMSG